jgi:hypothetical protein
MMGSHVPLRPRACAWAARSARAASSGKPVARIVRRRASVRRSYRAYSLVPGGCTRTGAQTRTGKGICAGREPLLGPRQPD